MGSVDSKARVLIASAPAAVGIIACLPPAGAGALNNLFFAADDSAHGSELFECTP